MIGRIFGKASKKPRFFAACEYWVYLPGEKLAPQEVLMARMVRSSPFAKGDEAPIGQAEGLLFSDIRLHVALVLRSKNPHHFRPDLFAEHIVPTAGNLESLAGAKSFAKLRFISEEPLRDARHLQFLPYLVESVAYYGKSQVVFDLIEERLFDPQELRDALTEDPCATKPERHLRTVWMRSESGGKGATRGLVKIGLPELETPESPAEHETIITSVLEEAASKIWNEGALLDSVTVSYFGDHFQVAIERKGKGPLTARILRVGSA